MELDKWYKLGLFPPGEPGSFLSKDIMSIEGPRTNCWSREEEVGHTSPTQLPTAVFKAQSFFQGASGITAEGQTYLTQSPSPLP